MKKITAFLLIMFCFAAFLALPVSATSLAIEVTGMPEQLVQGFTATIKVSEPATLTVSVDGDFKGNVNTDPQGNYIYQISSNGKYVFTATTTNATTFTTESKSYELDVNIIDNAKPEIIASDIPSTWTNGIQVIAMDVLGSNNKSSGIKSFTVNGAAVNGVAYIIKNSGTYTFEATDNADNVATKTVIIPENIIDTDLPEIEVSAKSSKVTEEQTFTINASDKTSGVKEITVNGSVIDISIPYTVKSSADKYVFVATDNAGNRSQVTVSNKTTINVEYNGAKIEFTQPPIIVGNDTVMVPVRALYETILGKTEPVKNSKGETVKGPDGNDVKKPVVDWHKEIKTVTVEKNGLRLDFPLDENFMYKNYNKVEINVFPMLINGSSYVPLELAAECLGITVAKDDETNTYKLTGNIDATFKTNVPLNADRTQVYSGKVNSDEKPDGYGTLKTYDAEGNVKKTTVGKWEWGNDPNTGLLTFTGYGREDYANGDYYEGGFVNGKKHGNGKYTWAKISEDDKIHENGGYYEGEFKDGRPTVGTGKEIYENGDYYEGGFNGGVKHGTGTYYFIKKGTWENDKLQ